MTEKSLQAKVFVVTHKKEMIDLPDGYQPIFVGPSSLYDAIPEWWANDSTGDSIHYKNPLFCELTALYWIWKNDCSDIVGLVHYRRFFSDNDGSLPSVSRLVEILDNHDAIVAKPEYLDGYSVAKHYSNCHVSTDLLALKSSITNIQPEYLIDLETVFNGYALSPFNMLFCKKEVFDSYCEWLFPF